MSPPLDRHRRTLEVYEEHADAWAQRRRPKPARAEAFSAWVRGSETPPGAVVDLGCGPGWHLAALPEGAVALDGAVAMLRMVAEQAPGAPRLQADLRHLPFHRGSLRAAWANKSYVHLARSTVPLALWDLHRALAVGGVVELGLFGGDAEHTGFDDDSFPDRSFSLWPEQLLREVIEGAGFAVDSFEAESPRESGHVPFVSVRARRLRTLADTVGPGMSLLLVGLNPSLHAADAGVGFSGPANRGWPALIAAGLTTAPRDPYRLLVEHRIGMTDLVKRATTRASEIATAEYRQGLARLQRLCAWLQPAAVCMVGLSGWRHAVDRRAQPGEQSDRLGGRPVWLMPNPSGLNAGVTLDELAAHFRCAHELARRSR